MQEAVKRGETAGNRANVLKLNWRMPKINKIKEKLKLSKQKIYFEVKNEVKNKLVKQADHESF